MISGRYASAILPVLAALTLLGTGCGGSGKSRPAEGAGASQTRVWKPGVPDTLGPTVAIVGTHRIRAHEIDSLIQTAPPNIRGQLREPEGYKNLVNRVVTEEVVYQAARRAGMDQDPAYQAALSRAARELMMRQYYQRRVAAFPAPSDSSIRAYYEAHISEFENAARARVRHIQVPTKAKAEALRKRLQSGGLWDALCRANSTDKATKESGGVLGFVTPESDLVPGIGKAQSIVTAAFALKEGETSRPIRTEKAWHLIRVDNVDAKRTQTLEQVRERISSQLAATNEDQMSKAFIDSLRTASNAVVFEDSISIAVVPARTPQDYFKEAQSAVSPEQRIQLYRSVVTRFPDDPVSMQAQFMVGFTYAEDLSDYEQAKEEFEKFIAKYPKSELANSARWMLENMDKPAPELKDTPEGQGGKGAPPDSSR